MKWIKLGTVSIATLLVTFNLLISYLAFSFGADRLGLDWLVVTLLSVPFIGFAVYQTGIVGHWFGDEDHSMEKMVQVV